MNLKTGLIIAGAAIVIVGTPFVMEGFSGQSDKEKILAALKESVEASKEGRPGGVMEHISNNFEVNGETYKPNRREMADFIRKRKPDIEFLKTDPIVSGDKAVLITPVKLSILTFNQTVPEVALEFEKESARKWLIVPTSKWRLVHVNISDAVISEMESQYQMPEGF